MNRVLRDSTNITPDSRLPSISTLHDVKKDNNSSSDFAKTKLNDLFMQWMSLPDSHSKIIGFLEKEDMNKDSSLHSTTAVSLQPHPPTMNSVHADEVDIQHFQHPVSPRIQKIQKQVITSGANSTPPKSPHGKRSDGFKGVKNIELDKENIYYDASNLLFQPSTPSTAAVDNKRRVYRSSTRKSLKQITSLDSKKEAKKFEIPQFYFPKDGRLPSSEESKKEKVAIKEGFLRSGPSGYSLQQFYSVVRNVCKLPSFFTPLIFKRIDKKNSSRITLECFETFWKDNLQGFSDELRIFNLMKQTENDFLTPADFKPVLKEILATHPGLEFLKKEHTFQDRYAQTVIIRIFYTVNITKNGRISFAEFKKSKLLEVFKKLESDPDINTEVNFFSYDHFYVIYCKFWELDSDHDLSISKQDLAKYDNAGLSSKIIDRIFSGYGRLLTSKKADKMSYEDFVWFCLSEEDKHSPTALQYWFRCVDVNGDGFIGPTDCEYFYSEQIERMNQLSMAPVPFHDVHHQILDMIKPTHVNQISIKDLKQSKMASVFFSSLFNLNKFLLIENGVYDKRSMKRPDGTRMTDWEYFCKAEQERFASQQE